MDDDGRDEPQALSATIVTTAKASVHRHEPAPERDGWRPDEPAMRKWLHNVSFCFSTRSPACSTPPMRYYLVLPDALEAIPIHQVPSTSDRGLGRIATRWSRGVRRRGGGSEIVETMGVPSHPPPGATYECHRSSDCRVDTICPLGSQARCVAQQCRGVRHAVSKSAIPGDFAAVHALAQPTVFSCGLDRSGASIRKPTEVPPRSLKRAQPMARYRAHIRLPHRGTSGSS